MEMCPLSQMTRGFGRALLIPPSGIRGKAPAANTFSAYSRHRMLLM